MSEAEKQIDKIMEKNNLSYGFKMDFPKYRELPDEILLSLKILNNHGMKVIITLEKK